KDGHQIGVSAIPVKAKIIAFIDSRNPLPMVSPPHTTPLLIIFDQYDKDGEVCVGAFDRQFYCDQLKLKLHVSEKTEILDLAGKRVDQNDLEGKMLFVFYDRATKSKPVQANPSKIIVTPILHNE